MALQPRIIACGKSVAGFSMGVRFLVGPAVMAAASFAVGLRGVLLHIAIVQVNFMLQQKSQYKECMLAPILDIFLFWHPTSGCSSPRDRSICLRKGIRCPS